MNKRVEIIYCYILGYIVHHFFVLLRLSGKENILCNKIARYYDYRDRYDDRYDGRYNEGWHREAGDRLRDTFNDALGGFRPDRY